VAKRRYTAEEIVTVLRQVQLGIANGKTTPQACRDSGITEQTYYRWHKEYMRAAVEKKPSAQSQSFAGINAVLASLRSIEIRILDRSGSRCAGWSGPAGR
jgi:Transposase